MEEKDKKDLTALIEFVKLQKNPKGNRRLLGVLILALVLAGFLSLWYFVHIKTNEKQYAQYSLEILDFNFERIAKQLDNDYLRQLSRKTKDSAIDWYKPESKSVQDMCGLSLPIEYDTAATRKRKLRLREPFDDYLVAIQCKSAKAEPIVLNKSFAWSLDSIVREIPYKGLAESKILGRTEHFISARRYDYSYSSTDLQADEQEYYILLVGVVGIDHYKKRTRALSPLLIGVLTVFLLVTIFGLPYFKLLFISESERIRRVDLVLSGALTVIGSLIFLGLIMATADYLKLYYNVIPDKLEVLAEEINSRFSNENKATVKDLYLLKELIGINSTNDTACLGKFENNDSLKEATVSYNFKIVGAVDESGEVLGDMIWYMAGKDKSKEAKSLSQRSYFKAIKRGDTLHVDNNDEKHPFYVLKPDSRLSYTMRPVVSIEDDQEEAVYIIKAGDGVYLLAGVQLKSIHEPILHEGYQFAVVNQDGEVWFHSEAGRSTLENIHELSMSNSTLHSAHKGHIQGKGIFKYRNETMLFHSIPIEGTGLTVITMYPHRLVTAHIYSVLPIYYVPLVVMLGLLGIIFLSLALARQFNNFLPYKPFAFDFLKPVKSAGSVYLLLAIVHSILAGAGLWLTSTFKPTIVVLSAVSLPLFSLFLTYWILRKPSDDTREITSEVNKDNSSENISKPVDDAKAKGDSQGKNLSRSDRVFITLLIVFNVFLVTAAFNLSAGIQMIWLFVLELLFVLTAIILRRNHSFKRLNDWADSMGDFVVYKRFLLVWLLTGIVLPGFILYEKSAAINDIIWIRSDLKSVAEQRVLKKHLLNKKVPLPPWDSVDGLRNEHMETAFYASNFSVELSQNKESKPTPSGSRNLYWQVHPRELGNNTHFTVYRSAYDQSWISENTAAQIKLQLRSDDHAISYSTTIGKASGDKQYSFEIGRWTTMALAILMLGSLISFYVERFFGLRFSNIKPVDDSHDKEALKTILQDPNTSGLVLVGPLSSGKIALAKEIVKGKTYGRLNVLDYSRVSSTSAVEDNLEVLVSKEWNKNSVILIENLEHNLRSFESNRIKLRLIAHLMKSNIKLIITSEVYPSQILDFYMDQVDDQGNLKSELLADYNAWRDILGGFVQVICSIQTDSGVYKHIRSVAAATEQDTDDHKLSVLYLNAAGYNHFADIWNALPNRERFLLYDLAIDDFVNIKHGTSLFYLMNKGLIVWDDKNNLQIFSEEFRNFILTSDARQEVIQYEQAHQSSTSWSAIRPLFYLAILTIIVFLALAVPNFFQGLEEFYGTLAGLGALIPVLSSFFFKRQVG